MPARSVAVLQEEGLQVDDGILREEDHPEDGGALHEEMDDHHHQDGMIDEMTDGEAHPEDVLHLQEIVEVTETANVTTIVARSVMRRNERKNPSVVR